MTLIKKFIMSKKFFLKGIDFPISMGDVLEMSITSAVTGQKKDASVVFDEELIEEFKKVGVVEKIEEEELQDFNPIVSIAEKMKWTEEKVIGYLTALHKINSEAVKSILYKEIAILLDKDYPNHISKSPEIWAISRLDDSIRRVNKDRIATYKNFAAFRSNREATFALVATELIVDILIND